MFLHYSVGYAEDFFLLQVLDRGLHSLRERTGEVHRDKQIHLEEPQRKQGSIGDLLERTEHYETIIRAKYSR